MYAGAGISASSRLSVNSSNHSGRSHTRSFESFESFEGFRDQFPEDELDNPGTTRSTNFPCINFLLLFGQPRLFTADPLVGVSVFIGELSK